MRHAPLALLLLGPLLLGLAACADEPGACVELVSQGANVASSWCLEVERPGECPYQQSDDEWHWDWNPGATCHEVGYPFDCGDDVWEDLQTEC